MKETIRQKVLRSILHTLEWWGIDPAKYELEELHISNGEGRVTFLHKENNKNLPYAERRLQITSFYYNEDGKLGQTENPILT